MTGMTKWRKPGIGFLGALVLLVVAVAAGPAMANMEAAKKWVNDEFQPSTLTKDQQLKEMEWFIKAAQAVQGYEHQGCFRNHSHP
jgi:glycerol transport system substrate-binding protein